MSIWKRLNLWHFPRFWQAAPDPSGEDSETEDEAESAYPWEGYCIAPRCFDNPERQEAPQEMESGHPGHPPVKVYRLSLRHEVPGMDFRWKAGLKVHSIAGLEHWGLRLKAYKAFALPHVLGLSDAAHWKWPFIPISFLVGMKGAGSLPNVHQLREQSPHILQKTVSELMPAAKVKILSPVGGSLALRPTLEILPNLKLTVRRDFRLGAHTYMSLGVTVQRTDRGPRSFPHITFQLGRRQENLVTLQPRIERRNISVRYRGSLELPGETTAAVGARLELPLNPAKAGTAPRMLQRSARVDYVKLTKLIGKREARTKPAPTGRYLEAQRHIGRRDEIVVVPGHFIDPEGDTGAPGERDFNKTVAEKVAQRLTGEGWTVLRPDRDAPHLMWEEYINWVSRQTLQGVPVIEIHGQGPEANMEGAVWGVIGDSRATLNKELAKEFNWYPSDWKELAVPRRGGVILEGFNSDEVLSMTSERRELAADRLAWRVWQCIETAGEKTRAERGSKRDRKVSKEAEHEMANRIGQNKLAAASTIASIEEDNNRSLEVVAMQTGSRGFSKSSTVDQRSKLS